MDTKDNRKLNMHQNATPEHREQSNNTIDEVDLQGAFTRRSLLKRTPPEKGACATTGGSYAPTDENIPANADAPEAENAESPQSSRQAERGGSPRQGFIERMKSEEDAALAKCKSALQDIKAAIKRQKNISKTVQDRADEMTELIDIIENCRKSWRKAEQQIQKPVTRREISGVKTPITSKRAATSPIEQDGGKKPREGKPEKEEWQVVSNKSRAKANRNRQKEPVTATTTLEICPGQETISSQRQKNKAQKQRTERRRGPKEKTDAVLIKPSEGCSYAEVLRSLRASDQIDETTKVKSVRKTRAGALLLELDKDAKVTSELCDKIKLTLRGNAEIISLAPKSTVEIRDLDCVTTNKEVEDAVKLLLPPDTEISVIVTAPNTREQVKAFVTVPTKCADTLIKSGRIKIGWVNARVSANNRPRRCFRCFGYGHVRADCKGPDRSALDLCIRCGEPGHKLKECTKTPMCCLCTAAGHSPVDHIPGSAKCRERKQNTK